MISFLFIVFCVAAGMILRIAGFLPADAYKSVNAWILYIAMPACFLRYIPYIRWQREVIFPSLSPVLVWIGAWIFFSVYGRFRRMDKATTGVLTLTGGLSNTAFLGFIATFYSEKEIPIAVLYDQMSFVLLSTAGIVTAIRRSGNGKMRSALLLRKLFKFPPFIVCMIALALPASIDISAINPLLDKIASTIGAMALFSIGLQLDLTKARSHRGDLTAGLLYKLFIAPLLVLLVACTMGQKGMNARISIFEAAMPVLATAGVLADEYGLNPPLANLMVGISILLSFLTMALWWWILKGF
jgi:predicted permease